MSYNALIDAWQELESTGAVRVRCVPYDGSCSALPLIDMPPDVEADMPADVDAPRVALSAGVHGDEPAAPWALLSLARDGLLDPWFTYRIWCCTNPTGYAAGTRENADGTDINRSFSRDARSATTAEARAIELANGGRAFALSLDLHEDFEAQGFYCYEPVVAAGAPLGRRVVGALDDAGLPVQDIDAGFDLGYPSEATHLRGIERGRVMPNVEAEVNHFQGLPYSIYLLWTGTAQRTLTLESPRSRPWDERIAMHRVAVVAALDALRAA